MIITQNMLPQKDKQHEGCKATVTAYGYLCHVASCDGCGVLGITTTVIDSETGEPRYSVLKLLLTEVEMLRINNAYLDIEEDTEERDTQEVAV